MAKNDTPKKLVDTVQPAPGYLLIEPEEQQKQTLSGIYLPETSSGEKPQTGKILAVGSPIFVSSHEIRSPGDKNQRVIYKKWGGNEVKLDGREYLFVKFEDILAVVS